MRLMKGFSYTIKSSRQYSLGCASSIAGIGTTSSVSGSAHRPNPLAVPFDIHLDLSHHRHIPKSYTKNVACATIYLGRRR